MYQYAKIHLFTCIAKVQGLEVQFRSGAHEVYEYVDVPGLSGEDHEGEFKLLICLNCILRYARPFGARYDIASVAHTRTGQIPVIQLLL